MLLQTDASFYDHFKPSTAHHSKYWQDRIADEAKRTNTEMREFYADEHA